MNESEIESDGESFPLGRSDNLNLFSGPPKSILARTFLKTCLYEGASAEQLTASPWQPGAGQYGECRHTFGMPETNLLV
jgi:hypothetical protein